MIAAHQLHLFALVSGIPEPRRSARALIMLQAMIDESDSHNVTPRIFVMGGYIASVAKWTALTEAWQVELDRSNTWKRKLDSRFWLSTIERLIAGTQCSEAIIIYLRCQRSCPCWRGTWIRLGYPGRSSI